MKKSDFMGWREVFSFTFAQGAKEKSYRIFLVVMFLVMLLANPVMTLFNGGDDEKKESGIEKLLVYDTTGLPIGYDRIVLDGGYEKVAVSMEGTKAQEYDACVEELSGEDAKPFVAVMVTYSQEEGFLLHFARPAQGISKEDAEGLVDLFASGFEKEKLMAVSVSAEQYEYLNGPVNTQCLELAENGEIVTNDEDEGISLDQYNILLGGLVIVCLFISFSGSAIATSIITEKSTRVIEYLMINVRPLALLIGKILGSLMLTVVQFAVIGAGYFGSQLITNKLMGGQAAADNGLLALLNNLQPVTVLTAVVMVLAGCLVFAILAGLAGASASKLEETQEAMKLFQMVMLVGDYAGIFLCIMQLVGNKADLLVKIFSLIPVTAPFVVPANLLLGVVSVPYAWLSILITLITSGVLFWFAASVYEALIFHTGKVLKFKDIVGIAKARKAGKEDN